MPKAITRSKASAKHAAPETSDLHYDKQALLQDYQSTFNIFMKALMVGVGGALVYFFIFVVYLGGWSHTKSADYAKEFNGRYPQDYTGLKLPEFGGPAHPPAGHE